MQTRFVSGHGFQPCRNRLFPICHPERARRSASEAARVERPCVSSHLMAGALRAGRYPLVWARGLGLACVGTGLRPGAGRAQLASVAPPARRLWMRASRPHRRGLVCPERSRPEAGAPKLKRPSRLGRKGRCPEGEGNPTGSGSPVVPQCRPGSAPPWPPSPSW